MSDRIEALRAFVTVAELGGFTAAGARLGLSQSRVSKQVASLERQLGEPLFRRTTRQLALTSAGERLLVSAQAAVVACDTALATLSRRDPLSGRLRISAPPNLALARLMPMLSAFQRRYPQIGIDARFSDARVDVARDGIDLAVRVGALGGARGRRVGTARRICVAAPDYLARAGTPRVPADLIDHACLTYALLEAGSVWAFNDGAEVRVTGPFSANDPQALRLAALAGTGVALSATWLFVDDLGAGLLRHVLPDHQPLDMPIHLVLRAGAPPPPLALLADFLADAIAADPLLAA
jgi:DNA-binding transcriptional LysR family regulator